MDGAAVSEKITEVDQLRLQLAHSRAEQAQVKAQLLAQAFQTELSRLGQVYGLTSADSVDMDTGIVTRKKDD